MATTKKTATKKAVKEEAKKVDAKATKTIAAAAKKVAAKASASKKQHIYIFFNCDDDKRAASMNVRYNNEAFADNASGRKALLAKVEEEVASGRVNNSDPDAVKAAILKGEPTEASSKLQYGCIERVVYFS